MDEKDLDKKIEALSAASDKMAKSMEQLSDIVFKQLGLTGTDAKKKIADWGERLKKETDGYRKSAKEINDTIKDLNKQYEQNQITAEELDDEIKVLRDQIHKTADQSKKDDLIKAKASLEWAAASDKAKQAVKVSLGEGIGAVAKGLANSFTSAAKAAASGGDAMSVAGAFISGNIDAANAGVQAGAKGLQDFGAHAAGAGGKLGKFGVVATVAGAALGFLSNTASELAKAGLNFMITQTGKLIQSFQELSAAGAIYQGGMMAQIETAGKAGMTLEQFGKAVSANREVLAKSGLGVAEGSKKMAAAMEAGGKSARDGMFALGMGMEEQAAAYANTMATMAGPEGKLKASQAEIAAQTQDYARNLKIVSSLTGEDAKAKQEKIRQENDTLAFNQKLAGMSEKQRAEINNAMLNMNDAQRQALRERMIYGTVISKDIAIAEATNKGIRDSNDQIYQSVKDGTVSAEKTRKIQADNAEQTKKDAIANQGLAMATGESARGAAKVNNEALKTAAMSDKDRVKAAEDAAKAQQDAGKSGKGGPEVGVMSAQQDFALKMQEIAAKNLPSFAKALQSVISDIEKSVAEAVNMGAKAASMPPWLMQAIGIAGSLLPIIPAIITMMADKKAGKAASIAESAAETAGGKESKGSRRGRVGRVGRGAADMAKAEGPSAGAKIGESLSKGLGGLGEGLKGLGQGIGGGISGILKGIASGLAALANPATLVGLGAVTLAVMGFATALRIAEPALEPFGRMIKSMFEGIGDVVNNIGSAIKSTLEGLGTAIQGIGNFISGVVTGLGSAIKSTLEGVGSAISSIGDGIGKVVTSIGSAVNTGLEGIAAVVRAIGTTVTEVLGGITASIKELSSLGVAQLLGVAGGITAIGVSLAPFALGGALAGLVAKAGGFKNITDGLQDFQKLDPDKLMKVAEAMKKVTESMPSVSQMVAAAASGLWDKLTKSGETPTPQSGTPGSAQNQTPVERREEGGPVKKGQPYIIGEKGPEIMWPDAAGKVLPSMDKAMSLQGGAGDQKRESFTVNGKPATKEQYEAANKEITKELQNLRGDFRKPFTIDKESLTAGAKINAESAMGIPAMADIKKQNSAIADSIKQQATKTGAEQAKTQPTMFEKIGGYFANVGGKIADVFKAVGEPITKAVKEGNDQAKEQYTVNGKPATKEQYEAATKEINDKFASIKEKMPSLDDQKSAMGEIVNGNVASIKEKMPSLDDQKSAMGEIVNRNVAATNADLMGKIKDFSSMSEQDKAKAIESAKDTDQSKEDKAKDKKSTDMFNSSHLDSQQQLVDMFQKFLAKQDDILSALQDGNKLSGKILHSSM